MLRKTSVRQHDVDAATALPDRRRQRLFRQRCSISLCTFTKNADMPSHEPTSKHTLRVVSAPWPGYARQRHSKKLSDGPLPGRRHEWASKASFPRPHLRMSAGALIRPSGQACGPFACCWSGQTTNDACCQCTLVFRRRRMNVGQIEMCSQCSVNHSWEAGVSVAFGFWVS